MSDNIALARSQYMFLVISWYQLLFYFSSDFNVTFKINRKKDKINK